MRVRMKTADVGRPRFGYSALVEVAESLHVLASPGAANFHGEWQAVVRPRIRPADLALLTAAVVPTRPLPPAVFGDPAESVLDFRAHVEHVRGLPADVLRRHFEEVWSGGRPPPAVRDLVAERDGGVRRLADALSRYWSAALEPLWPGIRAVLDDDVAFRSTELDRGGLEAVLAMLQPKLVPDVPLRRDPGRSLRGGLSAVGLVLVPSVFVWPDIAVCLEDGRAPMLVYAARGAGSLWAGSGRRRADGEALGALLGRTRAAILSYLDAAHSTTELAAKLGHSKPAVSQHLAVLRRSGLVTSWRDGRSVMYRRTLLASSVIEANRRTA